MGKYDEWASIIVEAGGGWVEKIVGIVEQTLVVVW
jgi:hypothetical protein